MNKLDSLKDTLTIAPEAYKDNVRMIAGFDDKTQKDGDDRRHFSWGAVGAAVVGPVG